jgi:hypothetical protein
MPHDDDDDDDDDDDGPKHPYFFCFDEAFPLKLFYAPLLKEQCDKSERSLQLKRQQDKEIRGMCFWHDGRLQSLDC